MKPNAFTVGHADSYDTFFREDPGPHLKLGPFTNEGEEYQGGIVFRTRSDAEHYLKCHTSLPWKVYGLILPNGWEQDVQDKLPGEDFHRLLCDAPLVQLPERDYYDELSDTLDEHPPGMPGVRR